MAELQFKKTGRNLLENEPTKSEKITENFFVRHPAYNYTIYIYIYIYIYICVCIYISWRNLQSIFILNWNKVGKKQDANSVILGRFSTNTKCSY